jgi:tRNA threonylcarbamoyladenosine biosynthesis protein TsaB
MPIFALETSTERLSLALTYGESIFVREIDAGQRHSELAIAAIADLFAEAKMAIADVDVIAFGQGPGSFVGVRIACGLAQGLALGAAKKLIPVPTQMALAEQAFRAHPDARNVLVAIDARMNEIYLAAYQRNTQRDAQQASGWHELISPMLVKPNELPPLSGANVAGDFIFIGSAFDSPVLSAMLEAQYKNVMQVIVRSALPCAHHVAVIAQRQYSLGVGMLNPGEAAPLYLRNHVAQTIEERATEKARAFVDSAAAIKQKAEQKAKLGIIAV